MYSPSTSEILRALKTEGLTSRLYTLLDGSETQLSLLKPACSEQAPCRKCDPSSRDDDGWTALDWAILHGQEQTKIGRFRLMRCPHQRNADGLQQFYSNCARKQKAESIQTRRVIVCDRTVQLVTAANYVYQHMQCTTTCMMQEMFALELLRLAGPAVAHACHRSTKALARHGQTGALFDVRLKAPTTLEQGRTQSTFMAACRTA